MTKETKKAIQKTRALNFLEDDDDNETEENETE